MGQTRYTSQAFIDPAFSVQSVTETDIPALGHDWMQVNTLWEKGFAAVTAKRVCRRDITHMVTETAQTIMTETPASCTTPGVRVYTAVFQDPVFDGYIAEFSVLAEQPLGHNWGEMTFTLNDGMLTASHVCLRDNAHTESRVITSILFLPTGTQAIEEEAFAGGPFEAVIIPDGCVSIGSRAFAGCENLLYVKIPASVTDIAPDAFDGCPNVIVERSGE